MDDFTRISMLNDFYGALLTDRQSEVVRLYYDENCSLSEIAGELDISRQAVHDAVKSAGSALEAYEDKLGLAAKFVRTTEAAAEIDRDVDTLIAETDDDRLIGKLKRIKSIIDSIDD